MTDKIVHFSQDGKEGAFTFCFKLDDGNGNSRTAYVNVEANEASTPAEAKQVAMQKAANERQEWMKAVKAEELLGDVVLPPPKKE